MKRIISLMLVLVLLLALAACGTVEGGKGGKDGETAGANENGQNGDAAATGFMVGYGKENITPDGQVAMGGYGRVDQRLSKGVLSYLYVTCLAVTGTNGETILIYGMDLCGCSDAVGFKPNIAEAVGIPEDNIMVSASHTHSAPSYSTPAPGQGEALQLLKEGLIKAAETAMADRKPAKMYGGSIETEGMNFVRHYLMNDGTYAGDNFGSTASGYKSHASEADNVLQLIKFVREGDNDIYLTNFQCHPHQTGGSTKYDLSADVVGEYRAAMEQALGCEVVYLSGAGGNINSHSRIKEEQNYSDWRDWGKKLAQYAQQVEFTEIATGKVQAATYQFEAVINHADDANAAVCRELNDRWSKGEISYADVKELGKAYGLDLNSPYHAGAIASRASMGRSHKFNIWAYSFGDVGLIAFPGEQFDTNGKFIKDNSPFAMTFVATKGNGENGYFPSEFAFGHGSYEVDTTKYVCGTAEQLADQYVAMLEEQYANK